MMLPRDTNFKHAPSYVRQRTPSGQSFFLLIFKEGKYSKNLLNAIYFALLVVPTVLPLGVVGIEKKEHWLHLR
jgi:hypothetical protein